MPREKKAQNKPIQTAKITKKGRVEPMLPGGFRDYGPADAITKQRMTDTIRKTFESFGFDPLETSSVQRTEVLTGGEEDSGKIIYRVIPAQRGEIMSDEEKDENSLRFDLTVPLARFVAANPDIPKPFKRYQIGNVWRGERQQQGRYREFMQADFDIIGSSSLMADAEIAAVYYTALRNIGLENFTINYNNRVLLDDLPKFAGFPKEKLWNALRIIDKTDKIGIEGVEKEIEKEFNMEIAKRITAFIFDGIGRSGSDNKGGRIYDEISNALDIFGCDYKKYFCFNLWLVRGLSYYTGSVFEVILSDAPELGSIGGGGRYDGLIAEFTGQKIPAVGASIGIDRLFAAMEKLGMAEKKATLTKVLVLNLSSELKSDYLRMVKQLRDAKINTSFYLGDDTSFQAQLSYAVKKEIPYVIIFGDEEKKKGVVAVKNLTTREQEPVLREKLVEFFGK